MRRKHDASLCRPARKGKYLGEARESGRPTAATGCIPRRQPIVARRRAVSPVGDRSPSTTACILRRRTASARRQAVSPVGGPSPSTTVCISRRRAVDFGGEPYLQPTDRRLRIQAVAARCGSSSPPAVRRPQIQAVAKLRSSSSRDDDPSSADTDRRPATTNHRPATTDVAAVSNGAPTDSGSVTCRSSQ